MAEDFYRAPGWTPGPPPGQEPAGETVAVTDSRMVGRIAFGDAAPGEVYVTVPALPAGMALWVCDRLPREPAAKHAAEQAWRWVATRLYRVGTLEVLDAGPQVSRCRVVEGKAEPGKPVYLVRESADVALS